MNNYKKFDDFLVVMFWILLFQRASEDSFIRRRRQAFVVVIILRGVSRETKYQRIRFDIEKEKQIVIGETLWSSVADAHVPRWNGCCRSICPYRLNKFEETSQMGSSLRRCSASFFRMTSLFIRTTLAAVSRGKKTIGSCYKKFSEYVLHCDVSSLLPCHFLMCSAKKRMKKTTNKKKKMKERKKKEKQSSNQNWNLYNMLHFRITFFWVVLIKHSDTICHSAMKKQTPLSSPTSKPCLWFLNGFVNTWRVQTQSRAQTILMVVEVWCDIHPTIAT